MVPLRKRKSTMMSPKKRKGGNAQCLSRSTFASTLNFVSSMGGGAWGKFQTLFFLDHGVTPSQLAIINCVQAVVKLIGYPTLIILSLVDLFRVN